VESTPVEVKLYVMTSAAMATKPLDVMGFCRKERPKHG